MEYFNFRAMNSEILMAGEGSPDQVAAGFQAARGFIEACEQQFSRFNEESELSQLNRSQGQWFSASPELFELVRLARLYFDQTGGLFNPAVLPDLKRIGYDKSMDEIRSQGIVSEQAERPQDSPGFEQLQLDEASRSIWLPHGMQIDLGGIAKGWIAGQAAQILKENTTACGVSAGGDMVFIGLPEGQDAWEVALEDPRDPDQTLALLRIGPGAVATSSVVKRSWHQGEKQRHHLVDPRSGEPAVSDWLSVTVIARQGTDAEVFAKVLLIAGPHLGPRIAAGNPEMSFIAVDRQGKLWGSQKSMEFIYVNA